MHFLISFISALINSINRIKLEPVFQSKMTSSKFLFLFFSVAALPIAKENEVTQQTFTLESTEVLQVNSESDNEQKIGWRTIIEEDGWLVALRHLSIFSVIFNEILIRTSGSNFTQNKACLIEK